MALRRPQRARHADGFERRAERRGPVAQQVVENRVQPLGRGVPRLHEVVVELDEVDTGDRHVRVGVGGEQHLARARGDLARLEEELRAAHLRHPRIHQEQRHGRVALLELAERLQCLGTGNRLHDPYAPPRSDGAGRARWRSGLQARHPRSGWQASSLRKSPRRIPRRHGRSFPSKVIPGSEPDKPRSGGTRPAKAFR